MAGVLATLTSKYREQVERNRNRPFLRAVMAACALVAASDGVITLAERVRLDQIMETLDALKVFDPHEGVDIFNDFTDAILAHPAQGHEQALAAIEPLTRQPDCAALLVRICLAVSEADVEKPGGEATLTDQIEIVSLCSRFNIDPGDCGLYIDKPVDEFLAEHS